MEGRLAANFDMITSEVLWSDRVYSGRTAELRKHMFGGEAPSGDRHPTFVLTRPPAKGEFSCEVAAEPAHLAPAAHNFDGGELIASVRLWRLERRGYVWEIRAARGRGLRSGALRLTGHLHEIEFPLPPPAEVSIEVKRDQP